jgi:hypothetical protein
LIQGHRHKFLSVPFYLLKAAYQRLEQAGVTNLFYIPGEYLFGDDGEGSTDGSHPNDLGFTRQAVIFANVLGPRLKTSER